MPFHWSIHQLTEYLVRVSQPSEETVAVRVALEEAAEALNCELGAVVVGDELRAQVGFGRGNVPAEFLSGIRDNEAIRVPTLGEVNLARSWLDKADPGGTAPQGRMVLGRLGSEFSAEELQLLRGMALAVGMVLRNLETLQTERARHLLVEKLLAIQKAISARRPIDELLGAITEGAWELLGGLPVALLLDDPSSPGALHPHSLERFAAFDDEAMRNAKVALALATIGAGPAGGRDERRFLCAPVVVSGETTGCLIAKVDQGSHDHHDHGELLTAFAQQVSLALTDARTVDAVRRASRDPVTGLSSRGSFLQRLEHERRKAVQDRSPLTVLFIDLDRFKAVNDTLGHGAGDDLLAEVGARIRGCARPGDAVARLGGDEFAVALVGGSVRTARAVAQRVVTALARPFTIAGREVLIGASVGIAAHSARHGDAAALVGDADIAMYRAKRSGRGRWTVFEPFMQAEVADKLSLAADLQHLVPGGQLWLAYQPIVRLGSGLLDGAEALARWHHPTRGPVPPSVFVPLAEETDAISVLGAHIVDRALSEVGAMAEGTRPLRLSLNISARQLVDDSLRQIITNALAFSGFPPELLVLEITESLLIEDPELARARLGDLKEIGLSLALDDFGTGYSSLSYLRQFPVDQVKIDRSFVAGLHSGATADVAIARCIVELCQRLRVETVAEGIETAEQLELLTQLGCDFGQGYLFAAPMPPSDWETWTTSATATTGGRGCYVGQPAEATAAAR